MVQEGEKKRSVDHGRKGGRRTRDVESWMVDPMEVAVWVASTCSQGSGARRGRHP